MPGLPWVEAAVAGAVAAAARARVRAVAVTMAVRNGGPPAVWSVPLRCLAERGVSHPVGRRAEVGTAPGGFATAGP